MAAIAQDDHGAVLGLWFKKFDSNTVLEAEAKAILKACEVAPSFSAVKIMIESDCKCLVYAVLSVAFCQWNVLTLVEYMKMFLKDRSSVSLISVSCLCNRAAHECEH